MKTRSRIFSGILISALCLVFSNRSMAQGGSDRMSLGIHFDPVISWFGSDIRQSLNEGARPGFVFGLTYNKYFSENYAFSAGLDIISAGGRLASTDTTVMEFANFDSTVLPGNVMVYKIQYLAFPFGLKLQTNQIGYITYFTDVGLDPKFVIGGKTDIPSLDIKGEKSTSELKFFNLGYHIGAGIEYSLGGSTSAVLGLNFQNNFLDVTKDLGHQERDRITHKLLSFKIGIIF